MKAIPTLLITLALIGCSADELTGHDEPEVTLLPAPEGETRAVVNVVDEVGQPFRPDQVWWYYPPAAHERVARYRARCADEGCTRWAVSGASEGRVYVAASSQQGHGFHCLFTRYDARPVELEAGLVPEVTLRLEGAALCQ